MANFGTAWRNAFGRSAAPEPQVRVTPVEQLVGTREMRRAQVDAAYRRAVREARVAGRPPPKRKSIERRFQRYAAAEGKERRQPARDELARMRRVFRREERKAAAESVVQANLARINRQGGRLVLERPFVRVSPKGRRGDRRGRVRQEIVVPIRPGSLDQVLAAEARGDRRGADDAMAQLVIDAPYFEGRLTGTDTMITEVGSANLEKI
jgi:hypothetical protein